MRIEIEQVRKEVKEAELCLQHALKTHLFWTVGLVGALLAVMRALDALLG